MTGVCTPRCWLTAMRRSAVAARMISVPLRSAPSFSSGVTTMRTDVPAAPFEGVTTAQPRSSVPASHATLALTLKLCGMPSASQTTPPSVRPSTTIEGVSDEGCW